MQPDANGVLRWQRRMWQPARAGAMVEATPAEAVATVIVRGDLDGAAIPEVAQAIADRLARVARDVVLDLGDVAFIDATGLEFLVRCPAQSAQGRRHPRGEPAHGAGRAAARGVRNRGSQAVVARGPSGARPGVAVGAPAGGRARARRGVARVRHVRARPERLASPRIDFQGGGAFYAELKARVAQHLADAPGAPAARRPRMYLKSAIMFVWFARLVGPPGVRRR